MRDCILWGDGQPAGYQLQTLAAIPLHKRVAIRAPHGTGKSAMLACSVLWFALTRDGLDWKVATTASKWRQLEDFLWPEIRKWARRIDWQKVGRAPFVDGDELQKLNLKLRTGAAFAIASDMPAAIEGAHADHLYYIFDEAKTIPGETFDAAEGAFSGAGTDTDNEAYAVTVSTPGDPSGRFFDIHQRKPGLDDWMVRHITLEEAIAAGRISRQWADRRKLQWGEKSQLYQNRVLGEFAANDAEGVIPAAWVENANDRWAKWQQAGKPGFLVTVGADISDSGDNSTVFALRYESESCDAIDSFDDYIFPKLDTMEVANRLTGILRNKGGRSIVDGIGVGSGVVNRLRELELPVESFIAGERTGNLDISGEMGFVNKRSAAWWNMRELLDPANDYKIALPPDERLLRELVTPRYKNVEGGKIRVETKDEIKRRLGKEDGKSTDVADAVVMAYWKETTRKPVWRVL